MAQPYTSSRAMPRRLSKDAPRFTGKRVEDFLVEFEALAAIAQLNEAEKCRWMTMYSEGSAYEVVGSLKEIKEGKWAEAKALLLELYRARDSKKDFNSESLRKYSHKKRVMKRRAHFDAYHRGFLVIYNALRKKALITEREGNHRFFLGIPKSLRNVIKEELKVLKIWDYSKPPEIDEVIKKAREMLKEDAYQEDQTDDEGDEPDTEEEASVIGSSDSEDEEYISKSSRKHSRHPRTEPKSKTKGRQNRSTPIESARDEVDELTEKLQKLKLELAEVSSSIKRRENHREAPQENRFGPCFMCGEVGTHRGGLRSCPETMTLIRSGLIKYTEDGRLIRTNEEQMPYARIEGGMAKAIRSSIKENRERKSNGRGSVIANLELEEDGEPLFGLGNMFALDADYDHPTDYYPRVYEATKSLKENKKRRFDPLEKSSRPIKNPKSASKPEVITTSRPPVVKPTRRLPEEIPTTEIRFQESEVTDRDDVDMVDSVLRKIKPKQFKFTTEVQDSVKADNVFQKVMEQPVYVSMKELLGTSASLSKLLQEVTKTQRKEVQDRTYQANGVYLSYTTPTEEIDKDEEEEEEKTYATSQASEEADPSRFIAMTAGKFIGHVGQQEVEMVIDTGSELNLMSPDIQSDSNLPMDPTRYKRWKVAGINGNANSMKGICKEVPITIGGTRFDHHFFVTKDNSIGSRRIILGQPFLSYHGMVIQYLRDEGMKVQIWNQGNRSNPSVQLTTVKTDDERNILTRFNQAFSSRAAKYEVEEQIPRDIREISQEETTEDRSEVTSQSSTRASSSLSAVPSAETSTSIMPGSYPEESSEEVPSDSLSAVPITEIWKDSVAIVTILLHMIFTLTLWCTMMKSYKGVLQDDLQEDTQSQGRAEEGNFRNEGKSVEPIGSEVDTNHHEISMLSDLDSQSEKAPITMEFSPKEQILEEYLQESRGTKRKSQENLQSNPVTKNPIQNKSPFQSQEISLEEGKENKSIQDKPPVTLKSEEEKEIKIHRKLHKGTGHRRSGKSILPKISTRGHPGITAKEYLTKILELHNDVEAQRKKNSHGFTHTDSNNPDTQNGDIVAQEL